MTNLQEEPLPWRRKPRQYSRATLSGWGGSWSYSSPSRSASSPSSSSILNPTSLLQSLALDLEFLARTSSPVLPRLLSYFSPAATFLLIFSGATSSRFAFFFFLYRLILLDFLGEVIGVCGFSFLQDADVDNFSIYIHSTPGFVFDETNTKSHFFRGRQLRNSIRVIILFFFFFGAE